jgi:predicted GIY-YIG superfamily endonuclease
MANKLANIPELPGVYVLKLTRDKYYVGWSNTSLRDRITAHFNGKGAAWTKIYKPIDIHEIKIGGNKITETTLTLQFMKKYGWQNVRGANWNEIELKFPPHELQFNISCFNCNGNHFIKDCPKRKKIQEPEFHFNSNYNNNNNKRIKITTSYCARCGRNNHLISECFAVYDVDERKIKN